MRDYFILNLKVKRRRQPNMSRLSCVVGRVKQGLTKGYGTGNLNATTKETRGREESTEKGQDRHRNKGKPGEHADNQ